MNLEEDRETLAIAENWCRSQGDGWQILNEAGRGGTAPVFSVMSPVGPLALKLYNRTFSSGERGDESEKRLKPQKDLGQHDCPYLIRVHDAGRFDGRLFVLMDQAKGGELEKRLKDVPRDKIRLIIDQIARAAIFLRSKGLCHRDIKTANIFVSDDYTHATLLDLSVLRDVDDPIGLGTDHGEQLPVVATSRYSPPEYLFRLIEAGRDLWHALDIYQLGGVLHDLIMREPMFESEYQKTKESNRYRFAWIVATQQPEVESHEVDFDIINLARRALDKNWERRSSLRLEDFLNESKIHQDQALEALGASIRSQKGAAQSTAAINLQMDNISREMDEHIKNSLRAIGITATHRIEPVGEVSRRKLIFDWKNPSGSGLDDISYEVLIQFVRDEPQCHFSQSVTLSAVVNGSRKSITLDLPDVPDKVDSADDLSRAATTSLQSVAADLIRM